MKKLNLTPEEKKELSDLRSQMTDAEWIEFARVVFH